MKADAKKQENAAEQPEVKSVELPDKFWWAGCLLITAIAIFLRVYWIDLKPLHHDEGVNGFFLTTLFREGVYKYDPGNYHGPTLYFIALAFTKILGLETFAIRYSVVIFGVGIVVLAFLLHRYIGRVGALSAALFLALSPGMVFVSRYFIHEILFVFFTFAMVLGVMYFMEKRTAGIGAHVLTALVLLVCLMPIPILLPRLIGAQENAVGAAIRSGFFLLEAVIVFFLMLALSRWRDGRPIYLLLAAASAALMFATKETAFISLGTMAIAIFCIWIYRNLFVDRARLERTWEEPAVLTPGTFMASFGNSADALLLIAAAVTLFIYLWILFFSSFFTYAEGIPRSLEAYYFWTKTGTKEHSENGIFAYFKWMGLIEAPIFLLGLFGSLVAFWKAQHRFAMFTALWAWGLMIAYTLIPYKTPWLALSFVLPMCIIAGYAINDLVTGKKTGGRILGVVLVFLAAGVLTFQTVELNFFRYDEERRPYVYAQTKRGFHDLIKKIEEFGEKTKKGNDISIAVVSPDYWGMPWYTRNYPNVGYHAGPVPANTVDLIITSEEQENKCMGLERPSIECDMIRHYPDNYDLAGTYPLRPGVELKLYVRNDIVGKPLFTRKKAPDEEIINPIYPDEEEPK
ncbi:MAG TPA: glycosyltransferase family 39 protein [Pyrinomonadaceae bacterium]|jgi:uncharacterized protein (TIGR03663 family)|nr:glycosyltransferase family 39 protein [Pyrinomonadaceae bacterium]